MVTRIRIYSDDPLRMVVPKRVFDEIIGERTVELPLNKETIIVFNTTLIIKRLSRNEAELVFIGGEIVTDASLKDLNEIKDAIKIAKTVDDALIILKENNRGRKIIEKYGEEKTRKLIELLWGVSGED